MLARWRSGNAGVCKTSMRGFDSLSRLKNRVGSSSVERFSDKEEADGSIPSRPTDLKKAKPGELAFYLLKLFLRFYFSTPSLDHNAFVDL